MTPGSHGSVPLAGPIFIHSSYRTSSTWLWTRFRAEPHFHAYYEIFHEALSSLPLASILSVRPDVWRSRHPDSASYMLEYLPLVVKDGGVAKYPVEAEPGARFFANAGIGAPLDADVEAYVAGLIAHAGKLGRIPVLTCTRILGRTAGLHSAFPGLHILLVRNLLHQWYSYSGQLRTGNPYFIHKIAETFRHCASDPFLFYLMRIFPELQPDMPEGWTRPHNQDAVFCLFMALHVYLLVHARRHCDLLVDVNRVAREPEYAREIEASIQRYAGLPVDLRNAVESIDHPLRAIADMRQCRILIDAVVARSLDLLGADSGERAFASTLLADTWREEAAHTLYTRTAVGLIAERDASLAEGQARQAAADADAARSQAELARLETEQDLKQRELERLHHAIDALKAELVVARTAEEVANTARNQLDGALRYGVAEEAEARAFLVDSQRANEALTAAFHAETEARRGAEQALLRAQATAEQALRSADTSSFECLSIEAQFAEAIRSLEERLSNAQTKLAETELERLRLQRAWDDFFERLRLWGGPKALRAVLPLARRLRPLIRLHGRIKRWFRRHW